MATLATWSECVVMYNSLTRVVSGTGVGSMNLDFAENEVHGYLASHFTVPFSSNNVTAKKLVIDMTYAQVGNLNIEETEKLMEQLYKRMDMLKTGAVQMVDVNGTVVATPDKYTVWSNTMNHNPVFGMSPTTSFEIDSSQVYSEENARGNI